jgi:hypothetical protein
MIIDYNIFSKIKDNNSKEDKLLYVLEQTPSDMVHYDISEYLYKHSYFASFNRPFFSETEEDLNLDLINSLYGDGFSRYRASRRLIFNKLQSGVKDLKSFKDVLRYNGFNIDNKDFPDDPSKTFPGESISARYDLVEGKHSRLSGGIDCKVTNHEMMQKLSTLAISGPTTDNNINLKPFDWNDYKLKYTSILGLPEKYDFKWLNVNKETLEDNNLTDVYIFK